MNILKIPLINGFCFRRCPKTFWKTRTLISKRNFKLINSNHRLIIVMYERYESIHLMFFKKSLILSISLLKERSDKCELLIDWIRCTLVQKQKRQKLFSQLLNDQYINILSAAGNFKIQCVLFLVKNESLMLIFGVSKTLKRQI